jgi:hypothetical protein
MFLNIFASDFGHPKNGLQLLADAAIFTIYSAQESSSEGGKYIFSPTINQNHTQNIQVQSQFYSKFSGKNASFPRAGVQKGEPGQNHQDVTVQDESVAEISCRLLLDVLYFT